LSKPFEMFKVLFLDRLWGVLEGKIKRTTNLGYKFLSALFIRNLLLDLHYDIASKFL